MQIACLLRIGGCHSHTLHAIAEGLKILGVKLNPSIALICLPKVLILYCYASPVRNADSPADLVCLFLLCCCASPLQQPVQPPMNHVMQEWPAVQLHCARPDQAKLSDVLPLRGRVPCEQQGVCPTKKTAVG